ncbi:MAG: ribbon-helix-helix protein, CopG family [Egibacteraceae bacterium]
MQRFQIYLDEEHHRQLSERAARCRTTVSALIRRAIDRELARPDDSDERLGAWRAAVTETAGCAPYLPEGRAYLDEIRTAERQKRADA